MKPAFLVLALALATLTSCSPGAKEGPVVQEKESRSKPVNDQHPTGKPHGDRKPNHLEGQTSPYLLQHLYNPVDWYPWGTEAIAKARKEDKPIFR